MSIYQFNKDEILFNVIKSYPKAEFFIYDSHVYYQNIGNVSGAFVENVYDVPTGFVSLNFLNVDRQEGDTQRVIGESSSINPQTNVNDTGVIYPYLIKDGSGNSFKTISRTEYMSLPIGSVMTGTHFMSASIVRSFHSASEYSQTVQYNNLLLGLNADGTAVLNPPYTSIMFYAAFYLNPAQLQVLNLFLLTHPYKAAQSEILRNLVRSSKIDSLKNSFEFYKPMSALFSFESGAYGTAGKLYQDTNLISIPSVIYGSEIKKGTVKANYYITGTLIATAEDIKQNGELIQTYSILNSTNTGSVVGGVMYKHGFMFFHDTSSLSNQDLNYLNTGTNLSSSWIYWGCGCNDGIPTGSNRVSASYSLEFKGTSYTPNNTYFATAPKGDLNWSNNPTFVENSQYTGSLAGYLSSSNYVETPNRNLHNVLSSSIDNYSASYKAITYINTINLYDDMGNLIGIAKTSKPIKKTEDSDFTFKLKLDM